MLTEEQWQLVQPLLPPPPASVRRGRPPVDQRRLLEAILWKLATRSPWRSITLPGVSFQLCYRSYHRWLASGHLTRLVNALLRDLQKRGGLDPVRLVKQGHVRFVRHINRLDCYVSAELALSWQIKVAMLSFQRLAAIMERDQCLAQVPDPLLEVFNAPSRHRK